MGRQATDETSTKEKQEPVAFSFSLEVEEEDNPLSLDWYDEEYRKFRKELGW